MNVAQANKLRDMKKILMSKDGHIHIGNHTYKRLIKRGYDRGDIVSCIMNGSIVEVQTGFNHDIRKYTFNYVIAGRDKDSNPIVIVLSEEGKRLYKVVTVMPPIDNKRFFDCI
ncbi:DUF4258 domain-containing protein [Bacillus sp. BRMEA1]|uniref:DUF4258 domain-containing protein n=1 Tax=Neobacillus endophyticus TaxID=2738405 RepID=UPI0015655B7A|nr:DUF4258 domain-containing protein [Neobacillus endophyticus]NRD81040.1 DUF4258 domain-containing protein [Neobacillus endophyticus]